jgi:hypothetical protein
MFYLSATAGPTDREVTMQYRTECLKFAEQFPTANVRAAIAHAESGRLTWEQIHGLFTRSLGAALTEVSR